MIVRLLSTSALRPKSASTVVSSRSVVSSSSAPSKTSTRLGSSSSSSSSSFLFATPPPHGRRLPSEEAAAVVVVVDPRDDELRRQRREERERRSLRQRQRHQLQQVRHHRSDYDGPGRYDERETGANFGADHDHSHSHSHDDDKDEEEKLGLRRLLRSRYDRRSGSYERRGYTVGIGGPVGSGKTALTLALCRALRDTVPMGVVTNDIFTQEDGEFLSRNGALRPDLIVPVETGGCPHAAIREDVSANLGALEIITRRILLSEEEEEEKPSSPLLLCESGGDNLAANFSNELADYTIYVIDVAGGDKVPRKGGPGITQSDLLVINKIDLADAVGSDLDVMARDARRMRRRRRGGGGGMGTMSGGGGGGEEEEEEAGPTVFASVKNGVGLDLIIGHVMRGFENAHRLVESAK